LGLALGRKIVQRIAGALNMTIWRYIGDFLVWAIGPYRVRSQPMPNCGPFRTIDEDKVIQPPKIKRAPFSKSHPMMSKALKTVGHTSLGMLALVLGGLTLWVLFPGAFHIGLWEFRHVFHVSDPDAYVPAFGPNRYFIGEWFIGLITLSMPLVLWLGKFIGASLVEKWEDRQ
jgi:hypothetical protein